MKRHVVLGAALLCALSACTSMQTIDFSGESGPYYRVSTADGRQAYGRDLVKGPDSTTWTDVMGRREALANADVVRMEHAREQAGYHHWSEGISEINARARHRRARVVLRDRTSFVAEKLLMARDTTTWFAPGTTRLERAATASIWSVRFVDGGRGILRGLGLGALAGALSGVALGMASGDDPPGWFSMTAGEKAIAGGIILGVLAAPIGAVVGFNSRTTYRLSMPGGGERSSTMPRDAAGAVAPADRVP